MRTGSYTISQLFGNRHVEQLVIPEIQRDYVWGTEHVERLIRSILTNFDHWRRDVDAPPVELRSREGAPLTAEQQALRRDFADFYHRRTHATNIGFIYAYCDADLPGQHFLIDGQQRLTTIYLALLAVGASQAGLKSRFSARYCLRRSDGANTLTEPTRLDYRLREHTADFLRRMVSFLLDHDGAAGELENQAWFLAEATRDTTTGNLIKNYAFICTLLQPRLANDQAGILLYEYLEDLVNCWYFDTNESAQGEELYLYLNARGESLANNENQKADLLGAIEPENRNEWGRKWEDWQDCFWMHRKAGLPAGKENPNADLGFNSFLECLKHLTKLRGLGDLTGAECLKSIEIHVEIIRWLEGHKDGFKSLHLDAGWVDLWFHDLWEAFNDKAVTDWKVEAGGRNQNRQALVWGSFLSVFTALEEAGGALQQVDSIKIFRAIRVFYLRSYNGDRSPNSLPKLVRNVFTENTYALEKADGLDEARSKWQYLKRFTEDERRQVESVLWKIEDHPLNLKAADLGGLNLIHLVDLAQPDLDRPRLKQICDTFYGLFPVPETSDWTQKKKLALILLCYGAFWHRDTPLYYQNFNFGNWNRTVRGKGSAENSKGKPSVFCCFFYELLSSGETLDQFLERKQREVEKLEIDPATEADFRRAVLWYSIRLNKHLFKYGMHITEGDTHGRGIDVHFKNLGRLWNTAGSFRGGYPPLSDLLKVSA